MTKGHLLVASAVAIWAVSSGILVKYISVSAFTLFSLGAFFGIIYLLALLTRRGQLKKVFSFRGEKLGLLILAGFANALNNGLFFTALKVGSVANATLTHYLTPILVAVIFAPLFLKETISKKIVLTASVGFLGLFILVLPDIGGTLDKSVVYGSLSAVFFSLSVILGKKLNRLNIDPLNAVLYTNTVPFLIYSPFALEALGLGISPSEWFWIVVWGISVLGVSFTLFYRGIKSILASEASILTYGEPIGAIILAALFFRELLGVHTLVGGLLILASGIMTTVKRDNHRLRAKRDRTSREPT